MRYLSRVSIGIGLATWLLGSASFTHRTAHSQSIESIDLDLSLPTADGKSLSIRHSAEATLNVYCFLGCECPLAKLYAPRLSQLAREFVDRDVKFVGINSNPQDTMEEIARYCNEHALGFPVVKDHDGLARGQLGATRTPEVIVVDARGQVVYRGRIDDQYRPGVIQPQPEREDLREAIEESLAGKKVTIAMTPPAGCLIAKARKIDPTCEVTYCDEVATILRRHCVECHRAGEIGPFALTDFNEVTGWADMIMETIDDRRMPPWHATANHEPLMNQREISTKERETLRRWIEGGMPYGDDSKLAPLPAFTAGWQLPRTPDQVLNVTAKPFKVVAEGILEYQYFVVDPHFTEDRWVTAAEILPGNRSVVHHAIAFIRPPDGVSMDGLGMLTAYVPGQRIAPVKEGTAKKIPAGSKLVFQMHYTPTGKEECDASQLGLLFTTREQVTHQSISLLNINHDLEIPPQEANAKVEATSRRFPKDGVLLSIAPHMHLRGKAISIHIRRNGKDRTILEVPRYDFNWQHTYLLKNPLPLSDVESIGFTATFDNSPENPFNPDPTQFVTWGDQTWEEMAVVFYEVATPLDRSPDKPSKSTHAANVASASTDSATKTALGLQSQVKKLMTDLDRDQNGIVEYEESDLAVKWRLFKQLDRNGDRTVTEEEATDFVKAMR